MILRRLASAIPTLFMVAAVTFFLGLLAPGSPIDVIMGQHSSRVEVKRLEHLYGLDRPPLVRFVSYLSGALHGDLGISFANGERPVREMIAEKFPVTAFLACMALAVAMLIGLPTGALAALKHNTAIDRAAMGGVLLLVSTPAFVLAPLLMLAFSLHFKWLPSSGWDSPLHWVMPVAVLAARPAALLARYMRSSMLDVTRQDYVRTAMAKGLSPGQIIRKHVLKNAFLPVLTAIGNTFGYLLSGSFVVETIFTVPGIGYESIVSILKRDYAVIQGVALLVAVTFILVNLVVDVLYGVVDPRVRFEKSR